MRNILVAKLFKLTYMLNIGAIIKAIFHKFELLYYIIFDQDIL